MQDQSTQFKSLLFQTYKSFKSLCEANDLKFVAAGGTALGAVRHQGIIPWDDDIDVYMPRADYNRFLTLKESLTGSDYEIVDPRDEDYHCMMAKFAYRNSTLWEYKDIPFPMGVYVDVFALDFEDGPYDKVLTQRMDYNRQGTLFCISAIQRSWSSIGSLIAKGHLSKGLWYLFQKCVVRPLRPSFRKTILGYSIKTTGEWLVAYSGASGKKDVYRAEWFIGTQTFRFEDSTIEVPTGYDAYLRHMYGDYMLLPPEEKQVSHHPHFYLNLERRITQDEVLELLESTVS